MAELVARIEELRRQRRHRRQLIAAACSMAACVAMALLIPFGGVDRAPQPDVRTYDVPVLIVDNRAPVALTPDGDSLVSRPHVATGPSSGERSEARAERPQEQQSVRPSIHRILVPGGQTYRLQLADGSRVVMNAGSSVSYRVPFDAALRELTLQRVDTDEYVAWIDGRVKYTDVPLVEVLGDLAKWYGVRLGCPDAGATRLTLDMSRQTDLQTLLSDLELLVGKKIQIGKELPME